MNENRSAGAAKVALGKVESAVGEALSDSLMQAEGARLQVGGRLQEAAGTVQETLGQAAHKAKAAASKAGQAYGRVADVVAEVDPFVRDRPYLTMALTVAAGLLIGLLIAGRGSKVVYLKPAA